jgi:hypothetical protein
VQQHVGPAVVGHDKAESLGDVEPFDGADYFDDIEGVIGLRFTGIALSTAAGLAQWGTGLVSVASKLGPHAQSLFVHRPAATGVRHKHLHLGRFTSKS